MFKWSYFCYLDHQNSNTETTTTKKSVWSRGSHSKMWLSVKHKCLGKWRNWLGRAVNHHLRFQFILSIADDTYFNMTIKHSELMKYSSCILSTQEGFFPHFSEGRNKWVNPRFFFFIFTMKDLFSPVTLLWERKFNPYQPFDLSVTEPMTSWSRFQLQDLSSLFFKMSEIFVK